MYKEIISDLHWLMFWCFWSGVMFAFSIWYFVPKKKKKKRKSKFPKCTCKDPNSCITWCHAKELFNKDFQDGKV